MLVSLIAGMGRRRVIGLNNELPWRLPADMRRFRKITMGKHVLMGRKTHQSIGKPLSGRTNLVLSRDPVFRAAGCIVVRSMEEALSECRGTDEVMAIGGAECYSLALPVADRMYLTYIDHDFEGDQYFPSFSEEEWREDKREKCYPDDKNAYFYSYVNLVRRCDSVP